MSYALKVFEDRLECLMPGALNMDEVDLDQFGKKHTNIIKLAYLAETLEVPGIKVPFPHGVSSDTIYAFLQHKVPEVFDSWNALGSLYASYTV